MRRHLAKFLSAYRAHRKLMPWHRALRWSLHVVRIDYRIARQRRMNLASQGK